MAPERVFFDTNILFHALDRSAGEKNVVAAAWVRKAWGNELIPLISVQVLQELFVNLTRKLPAAGEARGIVMDSRSGSDSSFPSGMHRSSRPLKPVERLC